MQASDQVNVTALCAFFKIKKTSKRLAKQAF
jgi:hypothetical protein